MLRADFSNFLLCLSLIGQVTADGYVFDEVLTSASKSGVCQNENVNRLCTTNNNGGIVASSSETCVGRNDIGELPASSCDVECAQARCEADEKCNGYVYWEGGHFGGDWNYRLVSSISAVTVVGGANSPHCFEKRGALSDL